MQTDVIYNMDALEALRSLPDESVHCCVTSPPYYALRDYGVEGQIGRESTPNEYVARLTEVLPKSGAFCVRTGRCGSTFQIPLPEKAIRVMRWTRSIPTAGPVRPWH